RASLVTTGRGAGTSRVIAAFTISSSAISRRASRASPAAHRSHTPTWASTAAARTSLKPPMTKSSSSDDERCTSPMTNSFAKQLPDLAHDLPHALQAQPDLLRDLGVVRRLLAIREAKYGARLRRAPREDVLRAHELLLGEELRLRAHARIGERRLG